MISFANEPGAQAPAQQVIVKNPLDADLDISTLSLTSISIPGVQVPIPPGFVPAVGQDEVTTNVDLRPGQNLLVNIDAKLDPQAGFLTWTFKSLDPVTGLPPTDPQVGFLPAGTGGSAFFAAKPKIGLPTGTQIPAEASVTFDTNPPVNTNLWINTLDNTRPTSQVSALLGIQLCPNFNLQWSGNDIGAGIQDYTIYVSDNGGAFTAWQTNTTSTSAVFNGEVGHNYDFYSIARDLVGNIEPGKSSAEATTQVNKGTICGPVGPPTALGGRQ